MIHTLLYNYKGILQESNDVHWPQGLLGAHKPGSLTRMVCSGMENWDLLIFWNLPHPEEKPPLHLSWLFTSTVLQKKTFTKNFSLIVVLAEGCHCRKLPSSRWPTSSWLALESIRASFCKAWSGLMKFRLSFRLILRLWSEM